MSGPVSAYDLVGGGDENSDRPLYVYVEPALLADLHGPRLIITLDYIGPERQWALDARSLRGVHEPWARGRGLAVVALAIVVAVVAAVAVASVASSHAGAQPPSPQPIVQPAPATPTGAARTHGTALHHGTARHPGTALHPGTARHGGGAQRSVRHRPSAGRAQRGSDTTAATCDGLDPSVSSRRCAHARVASDHRARRDVRLGDRVGIPLSLAAATTGTP